MKLYFLRHGLAGDSKTWAGSDRLRPLTPQGVKQMDAVAEVLAGWNLQLGRILTSPLVRARQTAEIVARRLGMFDRLTQDERLSPGCKMAQLSELLHDYPSQGDWMLVGHEPDFSGMLTGLVGSGRIQLAKGGLACAELVHRDPLKGELLLLVTPEVLIK